MLEYNEEVRKYHYRKVLETIKMAKLRGDTSAHRSITDLSFEDVDEIVLQLARDGYQSTRRTEDFPGGGCYIVSVWWS